MLTNPTNRFTLAIVILSNILSIFFYSIFLLKMYLLKNDKSFIENIKDNYYGLSEYIVGYITAPTLLGCLIMSTLAVNTVGIIVLLINTILQFI